VRRRASAQSLALLLGAALLLLGVLGFVPGITSHAKVFGLFRVSVLHNLVHLVLGAAGIVVAAVTSGAQRYLAAAGLVLLALWTLGVVGWADWLPVNSDDNWLHLALGTGAIFCYRAAEG
jgi:Domain of unknown function (DUF4383)